MKKAREIGVKKLTLFSNHQLETALKLYEKYGFTAYAIELKSNGELIGFIGLMVPSFEAHFTPAVEIAWRLASQHWGKGYATEAAKTIVDFAFITLKLEEIVSFTVENNIRSRRVMEKIGMCHIVHIKKSFIDRIDLQLRDKFRKGFHFSIAHISVKSIV